MELVNEKYTKIVMESEESEKMEGIERLNQESIRSFRVKENYKYVVHSIISRLFLYRHLKLS